MFTGGWGGVEGVGGGISCTPSKDFEKLDHKNVIKHEIRGPPPKISHNPKCPPQNNLKMTASMLQGPFIKLQWGKYLVFFWNLSNVTTIN
jgi:hypothetical protein